MKTRWQNPEPEDRGAKQIPILKPAPDGAAVFRHLSLLALQMTKTLAKCTLVVATNLPWLQAQAVGSWAALNNQPTGFAQIGAMLLLSDGTVLAHQINTSNWFRLTPIGGSYIKGGWTQMASMHTNRLWFASCLMRDGRVLVAGGEYDDAGQQSGQPSAEVYDPQLNTWTLTRPAGVVFADSESVILPDGKVLISGIYSGNTNVIYDPATGNWLPSSNTLQYQNEASWVKLPDDSILTIDPTLTSSERYIPSLNQWLPDTNLTVQVWDFDQEIGPGLLLPDGRAFFLGGNGRTVLYTPSGSTNNGSWTQGPNIMPAGYRARDVPAAMMGNGKMLCFFTGFNGAGPFVYYEYDYSIGAVGAFTPTGFPPGLSNTNNSAIAMLDLPDGTVLLSSGRTSQLYVYQPDTPPQSFAKPAINSITANLDGCFHLVGTQLNGLSQGAALGDDLQMDSNYPLVRLVDNVNGNVYYGRTFNWSSTSVRTGNKLVSTEFTASTAAYDHGASLVVVANGVASDPVPFPTTYWVDFNYTGAVQNGSFTLPYKKLTNAVNAVPSGGTILVKSAGHSAETMLITKAMKINAPNGTAIVGR
jgi:hypothetical protein